MPGASPRSRPVRRVQRELREAVPRAGQAGAHHGAGRPGRRYARRSDRDRQQAPARSRSRPLNRSRRAARAGASPSQNNRPIGPAAWTDSAPKHRGPGTLLWPRFVLAVGGPRWHRDGDHLERLTRAVGAELERRAEGNRQTDARPQVNYCRLLAFLPAPHPSRAADDVPNLLNGGMGNSSRDFAGLKLEVGEAAQAIDMTKRPDR